MADVTRVSSERLRRFIEQVFTVAGAPAADAATVAEVLVEADLRGVESHGSTRVAGYLSMIRLGLLNPKPDVRVLRDSPTTAMLEGDRAFGIVVAKRAMQLAIDKARGAGLGCVTARNVTHTGLVGFYPMMAARAGLIGLAMNNGPAILPPFGGTTPTYATNPFAAAFPAGRREPIVLDMATSVVAGGKLRLAAKKGGEIPDSCALAVAERGHGPSVAGEDIGEQFRHTLIAFRDQDRLHRSAASSRPALAGGTAAPARLGKHGPGRRYAAAS
jgi:LDH2 family malate/lactate/ureidoglycolate dehydrogenase